MLEVGTALGVAGAVAILVVVVVVVVVLDPAIHFPLTKICPSLLEQVLQATPPSLYVNA